MKLDDRETWSAYAYDGAPPPLAVMHQQMGRKSLVKILKGGVGSGRYPKGSGVQSVAVTPAFQMARQAIMDVINGPVGVDDHPVAIRAAHETAAVLAELKTKGYLMPSGVDIRVHGKDNPSGLAEDNGTLMLKVPMGLPPDVSLDVATQATYKGELEGVPRFVVTNFREVVLHEMGHIMRRRPNESDSTEFATELRHLKSDLFIPAALQVSRYAVGNPDEFVAEAFVKLYRGDVLSPETMATYTALRGAKIK